MVNKIDPLYIKVILNTGGACIHKVNPYSIRVLLLVKYLCANLCATDVEDTI